MRKPVAERRAREQSGAFAQAAAAGLVALALGACSSLPSLPFMGGDDDGAPAALEVEPLAGTWSSEQGGVPVELVIEEGSAGGLVAWAGVGREAKVEGEPVLVSKRGGPTVTMVDGSGKKVNLRQVSVNRVVMETSGEMAGMGAPSRAFLRRGYELPELPKPDMGMLPDLDILDDPGDLSELRSLPALPGLPSLEELGELAELMDDEEVSEEGEEEPGTDEDSADAADAGDELPALPALPEVPGADEDAADAAAGGELPALPALPEVPGAGEDAADAADAADELAPLPAVPEVESEAGDGADGGEDVDAGEEADAGEVEAGVGE